MYMDIYMFLEPANSDTENGIKKIKNIPWKKFMYSENWITWKDIFEMYQNNTVIGYLINFFIQLHFNTSRFLKKKI